MGFFKRTFGPDSEEEKDLKERCAGIARTYVANAMGDEGASTAFTSMMKSQKFRQEIQRLYVHILAVEGPKAAEAASIGHARMIAENRARSSMVADRAAEVVRSVIEEPLERDIPPLYPDYFERILRATGHPVTPTNMRHLVDRVADVITHAAALAYMEQVGSPSDRSRFLRKFNITNMSDEDAWRVCDDMIDWLWAWDPRCRKDLSERIPRLEAMLTGPDSALRSGGPELPPWIDR